MAHPDHRTRLWQRPLGGSLSIFIQWRFQTHGRHHHTYLPPVLTLVPEAPAQRALPSRCTPTPSVLLGTCPLPQATGYLSAPASLQPPPFHLVLGEGRMNGQTQGHECVPSFTGSPQHSPLPPQSYDWRAGLFTPDAPSQRRAGRLPWSKRFLCTADSQEMIPRPPVPLTSENQEQTSRTDPDDPPSRAFLHIKSVNRQK